MKVNIIWFKKDLRLIDNEALNLASQDNLPSILVYVFEKEMWQQEDASYRHFIFLKESLEDLQKSLKINNLHLNIFTGEIIDVFNFLNTKFNINNIYSHQETGNAWSFKRDIKVKNWCGFNKINWVELIQNGVIRCLKNRDGWSKKWHEKMSESIFSTPNNLQSIHVQPFSIPDHKNFYLEYDNIKSSQIGGRKEALNILDQFLLKRGKNYSKEMSSPVTAFESCSRISPYITFGCVSIKEVFQKARDRKKQIYELPKDQRLSWPTSLTAFLGRLRWHCHFIQKLEDEPEMEFKNLHPAYNNINRTYNEEYYKAWQFGKTGFPMIDASMRALIESGWINFRMRAMLVSFASNHLWLDWRMTSKYLARLFIDYEPGIHYSQIQMQSGTTGINAIRIYSPTKQALDQDPKGLFIRKYVPELKNISSKNIANPYNEPLLLKNYPRPIIDEKQCRKDAMDKLYKVRRGLEYKVKSNKILQKHGSRRSNQKI